MTALALSLVAAVAWLAMLFGRGGFWRLQEAPRTSDPGSTASVTVVIPARNEADGIAATIGSLLGQDHLGSLRIILVDDHSQDGTATLGREAALGADAADRLEVIAARDLPTGWTGKLWAVSEGLDRARTRPTDYLLLTDADITHAPDNVANLVRRAEAENLDLVSLMVRLSTASWAEKALIPSFVFFFFMLYPPRWTADPKSRTAGAAGGCMLLRPAALDRIGGIATIRGALIDDCALALAIKSAGGRISLDPSRRTCSSRVYGSWMEIWTMIARTAFTQLQYSAVLLIGTVLAMALTFVAPPILTLFARGTAQGIGAMAWIAMALCFLPTVRFYDRNPLWCLTLPVTAAFYVSATIGSAINFWRGQGGQWKGRAQAARPSSTL